jgi:hypothetical protein
MVHSELVQQGRVEVMDGHALVDRPETELVGRAVCQAPLKPPPATNIV